MDNSATVSAWAIGDVAAAYKCTLAGQPSPYNVGMDKGRHPNVVRTWKLGTPKRPESPRSKSAPRPPKSKLRQ